MDPSSLVMVDACVHRLKTDEAYTSVMCFSILALFSSVMVQGGIIKLFGGNWRKGQPHGAMASLISDSVCAVGKSLDFIINMA